MHVKTHLRLENNLSRKTRSKFASFFFFVYALPPFRFICILKVFGVFQVHRIFVYFGENPRDVLQKRVPEVRK